MNLEKTLALGMMAQLLPEEQVEVNECLANFKAVISKHPRNVGLVAYMLFSVAMMEEHTK